MYECGIQICYFLNFLHQVVTKIKVQEVEVDSQRTLENLRACERERDDYRSKFEESQSQYSQVASLLEKEQTLSEQLSEEVWKFLFYS